MDGLVPVCGVGLIRHLQFAVFLAHSGGTWSLVLIPSSSCLVWMMAVTGGC